MSFYNNFGVVFNSEQLFGIAHIDLQTKVTIAAKGDDGRTGNDIGNVFANAVKRLAEVMLHSDFEIRIANEFIELCFGQIEIAIAKCINKNTFSKGYVTVNLYRFVVA